MTVSCNEGYEYYIEFYDGSVLLGASRLPIGENDEFYDEKDNCTLYMTGGHEYTLKFSTSYKYESTGAITFTKLEDEEVESWFEVDEDGVLTGYTGNMINVRIPEGVTSIDDDAYVSMSENNNCGTISLYYPSTIEEITAKELNDNWGLWNTYYALAASRFTVSADNPNYKSYGGVIYTEDGETLVAAPARPASRTLKIPEGTVTIGENAFNNTWYETVEFPETLEAIGGWAFDGSMIQAAKFPEALEEIGSYAFCLCEGLEEVTFNGETWVDPEAFRGCGSLSVMNINANILAEAFEGCSGIEEVNVGTKAKEWKVKDKCLINCYDGANHPDIDEDEDYTQTSLVKVLSDYEEEELVLDDDIQNVASEAFGRVSCIEELTLGASFDSDPGYYDLFPIDLKKIHVSEDNGTYFEKQNVLYRKTQEEDSWGDYEWVTGLVKFPMASGVTSFTVPGDVSRIERGAFATYFMDSRILKAVTVPKTVSEVDWGAFADNAGMDEEDSTLTLTGVKDTAIYEYYQDSGEDDHLAWKTITPKVFTVKLNANGGKVERKSVLSVKRNKGAKLGSFSAKKSKKFFLGWYTKKTGGTEVTASTKITASKTYYAHWTAAEIGKTQVTVKNCIWNGKAQKPKVTVKLKGKTLKAGTDYTVKYSSNKEPGKGKVTIKGKGVFAKSKKTKTVKFTIAKAEQTITAENTTYAADKKGVVKLKVSVKGKAKVSLSSSNKKIVAIASTKAEKKKGNIKLVSPGEVTITIKAAATKHYKAKTKKVKVVYKGTQSIKLANSWLKYDPAAKVYLLEDDIFAKLIDVQRNGGVGYTCRIERSCETADTWVEGGNLLTAKGCGDFKLRVTTKATAALPSVTKVFTIRKSGKVLQDPAEYIFKQTGANTLQILEYIGSGKELTVYPYLVITDKRRNIGTIGAGAFTGKELTKVIFKDPETGTGITAIGAKAFKDCKGLSTVRLPSGLVSLGDDAFRNCSNLANIKFPNTLKEIGANAFDGCMNITGTVYLPKSLGVVGDGAFNGCFGIEKLMVYDVLSSAGANAFQGCTGIEDVYYSASKTRWSLIKWGTGNESVTSANIHYNAAGPVAAYDTSDISTYELLHEYPEYLDNANFEAILTTMYNEYFETLASLSDWDISVSAMKTNFENGPVYCLKTIFDDYIHAQSDTWTEQKIEKALALEMIKDVVAADEAEAVKKQYMDTFNKIYDVIGDFKDEGDDIFEDETTRADFAEQLAKCVKDRSASEFDEMLEKIQPYWKDKDGTIGWSITSVYKAAGKAIEGVDYVLTVIMVNELYRDYIEALMPYIEEGTNLYSGFSQVEDMMNDPMGEYIVMVLRGDVTTKLTDLAFKASYENFGVEGGVVSAAAKFYKVLGSMIDAPTIDEYNNAWMSLQNTAELHKMFRNANQALIDNKGGDVSDLVEAQDLIASFYFTSLKKTGEHMIGAVDEDDKAYMKQFAEKYEAALNNTAFLRSCKENLAESR